MVKHGLVYLKNEEFFENSSYEKVLELFDHQPAYTYFTLFSLQVMLKAVKAVNLTIQLDLYKPAHSLNFCWKAKLPSLS